MFPVIKSLLEGYDRSKRNQEHYDDLDEWKKAARQAGCDVRKKDAGWVAEGHEGEAGEFGTVDEGEGWLVAKWYKKPVDEAKKADPGPVGVPNLTPAAKKNRKMAQHVVKAYKAHVMTSGHNKSYAKNHRAEMKKALDEGMFVVKSADGVEKRFRDADSVEARAWKSSTAKKSNVKLAVYSDAYWEKKADDSEDMDYLTPWTKIGTTNDDNDAIERIVKDQHGAGTTDWTFGKAGEEKREGTSCATRVIRVMFEYGPEDDMGVDEPTSDVQSILVARNPKKPKQIDFVKYVG